MKYFEGVRRRTVTAVDRVTPPLATFRPRPGEWVEDRFTTDLDLGPAESWDATRARLDATHAAEMARLRALPDSRLNEKVDDLDGGRMSAWRFLMAMVEHEVHHRSQLAAWLALAGTEPPQIYGYRMEDVVERARRGDGAGGQSPGARAVGGATR